jgi:penicillin-insensitive murein DD-endopeptidase
VPDSAKSWPLCGHRALPRGVRPASLASAAIASLLTLSTGALPGPKPKHPTTARISALGPAALRFGRSIGSPTEGHLLGGMHLVETPYLRVVPADTPGDVRWGLEPLVTMLDRAARGVRRQYSDAVTSVGHLSREGGGEVDQHRSHESGRDADVGFFVRSKSGRELLAEHFVPFRPDGTAPSWPGAYFDDARNWALVASLIGDPQAHVTHLFIAVPLRARLLAYAERIGAPSGLRMRAAEVMQQPHGTLPHDDHFHVRIGCPPHMSGCVENPAMRAHRAEPVLARGRRGGPVHALVTPAPKHESETPMPAPAPPPPAPAQEPREGEPASQPEAPPVMMPAPIDDVDG